MDTLRIDNITRFWGVSCKRIRQDIVIPGSPERCLERFIVEDEKNLLFILEKISQQTFRHKTRIIHTLHYLYEQCLPGIHPYLSNSDKQSIAQTEDGYYQMSPFVAGVELSRPAYVGDGWRGAVMADFLAALRQASSNIPYYKNEAPFSIKTYIEELMTVVKRYEPTLSETLLPVVTFLERRFMDLHDQLPNAFCHGDYHPLNIIWGSDDIRAVIDWEFAGYKPEIYDTALLIGCIGMEDPEGMLGELVLKFIHTMKEKGQISELSWDLLVEFVIALRFAWLAEWLRKCDAQMVTLEAIFLKLLVDHADLLKKAWSV